VAEPTSASVSQEERYEEIVQRLAKVVEKLEGGGLSLEESIAAFEEGIRLARAGAARLDRPVRHGLADGKRRPRSLGGIDPGAGASAGAGEGCHHRVGGRRVIDPLSDDEVSRYQLR